MAGSLSLGVWSPSVSGATDAGDWWPGACSESLKEEEVRVWTLGWVFIGRTDAEAVTPILSPPDVRN